MVACIAALILVWLGWSLWQPSAPESSDPAGFGAFTAFALALLLLSVALVIFATLFVRASDEQHRLAEQLRDSRDTLRRFDELLDVWQWRSDSAHRLIAMHAPNLTNDAGAAASWSTGHSTPLLWEHFVADDPAALRASLERGLPLADTAVRHHDAAVAARARLRGRPVFDRHGAFAGYQGTLRELADAPVAAPADRPAPTPGAESDSFSYTVSHDLRAPIRVVEGFTKIVKEDYGRLLDRVGNDHLDRVLGAAARMNNMIDALLALSKLSSQPLVRQGVNLSQLAAYVADDLRRQSPGRQVGIEIEPDMQIEGDPTLLRVVVENLLGNAWKYTGKCEQAQIWFERGPGPDSFVIRDNGAGFDMRFADRLFGVFQRLHSANDFPGTGIGLASVRRIVSPPRRRHLGRGSAEPGRALPLHAAAGEPGLTRVRRCAGQRQRLDRFEHALGLVEHRVLLAERELAQALQGRVTIDRMAVHQGANRHPDHCRLRAGMRHVGGRVANRRLRLPAPGQHGLDDRQDLPDIERLDQRGRRAERTPARERRVIRERGQEDERDLVVLAQVLGHVEAALALHADVEQRQRRLVLAGEQDGVVPVVGVDDPIARLAQPVGQRREHQAVVVDDQDRALLVRVHVLFPKVNSRRSMALRRAQRPGSGARRSL